MVFENSASLVSDEKLISVDLSIPLRRTIDEQMNSNVDFYEDEEISFLLTKSETKMEKTEDVGSNSCC